MELLHVMYSLYRVSLSKRQTRKEENMFNSLNKVPVVYSLPVSRCAQAVVTRYILIEKRVDSSMALLNFPYASFIATILVLVSLALILLYLLFYNEEDEDLDGITET